MRSGRFICTNRSQAQPHRRHFLTRSRTHRARHATGLPVPRAKVTRANDAASLSSPWEKLKVFHCMRKLALAVSLIGILSSGAALAEACNEPFSRPSYPTRQAFCQLGDFLPDAYAPGRLIPCEEVEVDHLISLRQAWASGVCGEDLKRLARDPRNLRLTHWLTNRRKGYLSPEEFALRLPSDAANQVLRDANALMRDYGIKPREEAMLTRMLAVAKRSAGHLSIPLAAVPRRIAEQMTFRQVGGRTVAFVGKKAVGIAIGAGVAIEGISAANWAVGWLITPEQSDRMEARADELREVFRGE